MKATATCIVKHLWIKETLLHVTIVEQKIASDRVVVQICLVWRIGSAVVACIYMI